MIKLTPPPPRPAQKKEKKETTKQLHVHAKPQKGTIINATELNLHV